MRIIGLDIGSYSVKAVELEAGLRSTEILEFFEEKLPVSETPPTLEQIREAIKNIFLKHKITPPFKLTASINGLNVSSRMLTFPFKDKAKIKQTLPFELEEHVPFSVENIVYAYQLSTIGKEKSNVLVLMTPKENVQEGLIVFDQPEISPDLLTTDSVSLSNLSEVIQEPQFPYALVNIGKSKTTLCILHEGVILGIRSIPIAGDHITQQIKTDYKLSYEEAETAKIDNGFVLTDQTDVTEDQKKFSACIQKSLDTLIGELSQTFQSHRSRGLMPVKKLFLTGRSSLLRNLAAYVAHETNLEVELLNCLRGNDACNIADNDENNAAASTALSLGLGLMGRNYNEQFDFRKDEFSKYKRGAITKEVKMLIGTGLLIILIMFFNIFGNYFIANSTLKKIDEQMAAVTQKFPIKIKPSLLDSPTQLRAFLNKEAKDQKEKLSALGGEKTDTLTLLQVLKEISAMIPKEVLFDVRELSIVDLKVRLKGISDSFNAIDNIEKSFKNHREFANVVKGEIQTAADGKNKNFTISFDVRKKK